MPGDKAPTEPAPRGSALVAGGGTAGHLVPGLAVAQALVEQGWPVEQIHFVGSERGLDKELVPAAGFSLTVLPGRGINRRRINFSNLLSVWSLLRGITKGVRLVRKTRPTVVMSLGGYAALPAAVGAVVWRVPLVLLEQNAAASATNKLLSRFAKAAAVPTTGTGLRREVVTGNPVRSEVAALAKRVSNDRQSAQQKALRQELLGQELLGQELLDGSHQPGDAAPGDIAPDGAVPDRDVPDRNVPDRNVPDRNVIVIFGGSLGSRRINQATWQLVELMTDKQKTGKQKTGSSEETPIFIYHVVGKRDWDDLPPKLAGAGPTGTELTGAGPTGVAYRAVRYDDNLPRALAAADLVVCRAGASTVSELSVLAKRAVLVPLPGAPNDHQQRNAESLASIGQAKIIADAELDGERLQTEIMSALKDDEFTKPSSTADGPATDNTARPSRFSSPESAQSVAQLAIRFASQTPDSVSTPDPDAPNTGRPSADKFGAGKSGAGKSSKAQRRGEWT